MPYHHHENFHSYGIEIPSSRRRKEEKEEGRKEEREEEREGEREEEETRASSERKNETFLRHEKEEEA